jgi:hypothetical protein
MPIENTHMLLFSTVLFVDGNPVGYQVFEENDQLILNPAENPSREIVPPRLSASQSSGSWKVEGTLNRDLIDQVIEDINYSNCLPKNGLSAAP